MKKSPVRHRSKSQDGVGQKPDPAGKRGHTADKKARSGPADLWQWIQRQSVSYLPVNWPVKLVMTAVATFVLSRVVSRSGDVKMEDQDIIVYSSIYCGWAIFFLPDVMLRLSTYVMGKLLSIFIRLFLAELVMCLYLYFYKREGYVLQRGVSLRPLLRPEYQWMEEMIHSIRYVVLVGCMSASVVNHLFDRPEILLDYVEYGEEDDDRQ
ncbi:uncharacterized protein LOC143289555 isoform X1 [Babylonia areolata]|uniref:uncharacterized protein LOC143289555 isoform X1 n=1 Tax=Babylonia areolata TaxID=304850 RepID=UPI003FD16A23